MKLKGIKHIGIIGTGMMGASLAVLFTGNGYKTTIYALDEQQQSLGYSRYTTFLEELVDKKALSREKSAECIKLINISTDYEDLAEVEFVFECVFERLDVKHEVYKMVEKYCKSVKAIASSTSAIGADELAEGLVNKEKLVVAHPWNPPHLVPCVELVRSKYTSEEALNLVMDILESVKREVVVLQKSIPGFIGNRLQYAMYREALHIVETGAATPEDIDKTLKSSFAPRYTSIGLFEHFDNCGLDLASDISDYLFPHLCDDKESPKLLKDHCSKKEFGIKSGKGILNWEGQDLKEFGDRVSKPYLSLVNFDSKEIEE